MELSTKGMLVSPLLYLQVITTLLSPLVMVKFWFPCLCLQVSSYRLLIYLEKKDPSSHWSEAFSKFHQRISLVSQHCGVERARSGVRLRDPSHGRATATLDNSLHLLRSVSSSVKMVRPVDLYVCKASAIVFYEACTGQRNLNNHICSWVLRIQNHWEWLETRSGVEHRTSLVPDESSTDSGTDVAEPRGFQAGKLSKLRKNSQGRCDPGHYIPLGQRVESI